MSPLLRGSQQQLDPVLVAVGLQRTVNERLLWRNIGLSVKIGEIWFVRGPSGVGKTLLLRALSCLDTVEVSQQATHVSAPAFSTCVCTTSPPVRQLHNDSKQSLCVTLNRYIAAACIAALVPQP